MTTSAMKGLRRLALISLALLAPTAALAQGAGSKTAAGKVVLLAGQVTAVNQSGQVRTLAKDDPVFAGEIINSGLGSYVNLRFSDGGFFLLRPETRFQIEDYRYSGPDPSTVNAGQKAATAQGAPAPTVAAPLMTAKNGTTNPTSRAFFRLVKGGFRSVSGLIGKVSREDYRVSTPVATIGIRGTLFTARICQGQCSDRAEINSRLKKAGVDGSNRKTILITTVDEGEISVTARDDLNIQPSGAVFFTDEDGSVTAVEEAPGIEQRDQGLNPETCQ